jgi:hypothetical protein
MRHKVSKVDLSLVLAIIIIYYFGFIDRIIIESDSIRFALILWIVYPGYSGHRLRIIIEDPFKSKQVLCFTQRSLALEWTKTKLSLIDKLVSKGLVYSFSWRKRIELSIVKILVFYVLDTFSFRKTTWVPFSVIKKIFIFEFAQLFIFFKIMKF